MNLMVITNQKSTIDTNIKQKKEFKHNTKDSHQITKEESKRRNEQKGLQKQVENNKVNEQTNHKHSNQNCNKKPPNKQKPRARWLQRQILPKVWRRANTYLTQTFRKVQGKENSQMHSMRLPSP